MRKVNRASVQKLHIIFVEIQLIGNFRRTFVVVWQLDHVVNYNRAAKPPRTSGAVSSGMVTVRGFQSCTRVRTIVVYNQPPRPTQPGHPTVGRREMSTIDGRDYFWGKRLVLGNRSTLTKMLNLSV